MRRLVIPGLFLVATGRTTRDVSSFSTSDIPMLDQEMQDEEQLARLLVQDSSTTVVPLSTSKIGITSGYNASFAPRAAEKWNIVESKNAGEETLAEAFLMEDNNDAFLQRDSLPITQSRRENDKFSRYAHVRRAVHTKIVKEGSDPVKETAIEWMCSGCRTYNFIGRKLCRRCKQSDVKSFKHKLPPARHIPLFPTLWTCHSCGFLNRCDYTDVNNRVKFFCDGCGERFAGVREWYCPSCHHINSRGSTQCATCYNERPCSWTCSSCKYKDNSVFFTECHNCHASRPKRVSDSTALCPTCRQRNDVQWEMCFLCMTPLGMMLNVKKLQNKSTAIIKESRGISSVTTEKGEASDVTADVPLESNTNKLLSVNLDEVQAAEIKDITVSSSLPQQGEEKEGMKEEETEQKQQRTSNKKVEPRPQKQNIKIKEAEPLEDGTWWCSECQVLHRRNVAFCDICLKPKAMVNTIQLETLVEDPKQTGWICGECAHHNVELPHTVCKKCHKPKPHDLVAAEKQQNELKGVKVVNSGVMGVASTLSPVSSTGEWRCPYCRKLVDVMVTSCCGTPREIPFGYWLCATCCSTNRNERRMCLGCGAAPPAKPWNCFGCRFKNNINDLICVRCGSQHLHHWKCGKCGAICQQASDGSCSTCGAAKPSLETLSCPQCCASNNVSRKSCYRCRARLLSNKWRCAACGSPDNEKRDNRCKVCCSPREYNMKEIIWICDVCNTGVASGGDLPVRTQCPRCTFERTERSLCFPSRWKCRNCSVTNLYLFSLCTECGCRRVLDNMHTYATCFSCFHITLLTEQERCNHCGVDLSRIINEAGNSISLSGISPLFNTSSADGVLQTESVISDVPVEEKQVASTSSAYNRIATQEYHADEHVPESEDIVLDHSGNVVFDNFSISSANTMTTTTSTYSSPPVNPEPMDGENEGIGESDVVVDFIGEREEQLDVDTAEWCGVIPSWICVNCETTNLEEADVCACCFLRRGED